jgi:hypothetical protein
MSYIQTLSGKKFDYLNSTTDDVEIEDIATALSHICRFSGHLPNLQRGPALGTVQPNCAARVCL